MLNAAPGITALSTEETLCQVGFVHCTEIQPIYNMMFLSWKLPLDTRNGYSGWSCSRITQSCNTRWDLLHCLFESQSQSAPQNCSTVQYGFCPAATMQEYLRRWTATARTSQTSNDVTIVFLARVFSREGTQKNYYTRMEENPPKQKWRSFLKKQCVHMNVKCITHNHGKVTKEWFITSTWLQIL